METAGVVQRFYDGIARKDAGWHDLLSDDVTFSDASGKLQAHGRDAFIQSFTSFLRAVEKVQVMQLIVEGENAAAVVSYDYVNPRGEKLHQDDAEVWTVRNGAIGSLTIYFDITEFRGFMTRQ
jgi:ketosteroid isomerase-like protein